MQPALSLHPWSRRFHPAPRIWVGLSTGPREAKPTETVIDVSTPGIAWAPLAGSSM
jgi:hypothetical protein